MAMAGTTVILVVALNPRVQVVLIIESFFYQQGFCGSTPGLLAVSICCSCCCSDVCRRPRVVCTAVIFYLLYLFFHLLLLLQCIFFFLRFLIIADYHYCCKNEDDETDRDILKTYPTGYNCNFVSKAGDG